MDKKLYIQPALAVDEFKIDDAFMLTVSLGDNNPTEVTETTGQNGITEGDAKERDAWNEGLW